MIFSPGVFSPFRCRWRAGLWWSSAAEGRVALSCWGARAFAELWLAVWLKGDGISSPEVGWAGRAGVCSPEVTVLAAIRAEAAGRAPGAFRVRENFCLWLKNNQRGGKSSTTQTTNSFFPWAHQCRQVLSEHQELPFFVLAVRGCPTGSVTRWRVPSVPPAGQWGPEEPARSRGAGQGTCCACSSQKTPLLWW